MKAVLKSEKILVEFELTNDDQAASWNIFFQFIAAMLREKKVEQLPE